MKRKILQLILVLLLLSSPLIIGWVWEELRNDRRPIYYKYNNTVITRVNVSKAETRFYYGKFDKRNLPDNYIKAEYNGFDGFMDALLWFKKNGDVQLIRWGGGWLSQEGIANDRFCIKSYEEISCEEGAPNQDNYGTAIRVSEAINYERECNIELHSLVKAIYPE